MLALYDENASLEDPVGTEVLQGKAALTEFYGRLEGMDMRFERTGPVRAAANELVFPFKCFTTADGVTMVIEIIDHFILNDQDLVVSMRAFWSQENMSLLNS